MKNKTQITNQKIFIIIYMYFLGKGMIMQGVQSDLRSLSETGPRKPEDLKHIR